MQSGKVCMQSELLETQLFGKLKHSLSAKMEAELYGKSVLKCFNSKVAM